jgi:hypothetical protein
MARRRAALPLEDEGASSAAASKETALTPAQRAQLEAIEARIRAAKRGHGAGGVSRDARGAVSTPHAEVQTLGHAESGPEREAAFTKTAKAVAAHESDDEEGTLRDVDAFLGRLRSLRPSHAETTAHPTPPTRPPCLLHGIEKCGSCRDGDSAAMNAVWLDRVSKTKTYGRDWLAHRLSYDRSIDLDDV